MQYKSSIQQEMNFISTFANSHSAAEIIETIKDHLIELIDLRQKSAICDFPSLFFFQKCEIDTLQTASLKAQFEFGRTAEAQKFYSKIHPKICSIPKSKPKISKIIWITSYCI